MTRPRAETSIKLTDMPNIIIGVIEKIIRKKLTYKNVSSVATALMVIGMLVLIIFVFMQKTVWHVIGFLIFLVFLILGLWLNHSICRCPHCDESLSTRRSPKWIRHCPRCGEKIDWT